MPERCGGEAPLTASQLVALVAAAGRQLSWGQRLIARENARWLALAGGIPHPELRAAARQALLTKRGHTDGAGLFAILLPRRNAALVRLLVAFEVIWDYLDSVHELAPDEANGRQLHLALWDALAAGRPLSDWYAFHSTRDDGGYLDALVRACRIGCTHLPSYALVRDALAREAWRAQVLALNHIIDARVRDAALRAWVASEFPGGTELEWWEVSGAASSSMVVHVLLALAADPETTAADVAAAHAAYWPAVSLATTMLDSFSDIDQDERTGDHSYVGHYPSTAVALLRLRLAVQRAVGAVDTLRRNERHRVIVGAMVAMYLSKDSSRARAGESRDLAAAAGGLTRTLLPLLRLWRIRYGQQAF